MKTLFASVIVAIVVLAGAVSASAAEPSPAGAGGYDKAIEGYVRFLEKQKTAPAEYVLGLFKQNDLVILCERAHPEVTQYDMIYEIASDPRFQQQEGHIFTEVGGASLRPYIETFLMDEQLTDTQVTERLRYIARNIGWNEGWEKTNFYDFLKRIYYLNRSLPRDRRVHVYPSDLDFDWKNATRESWAAFKSAQLDIRDKLIGQGIASEFNSIRQAASGNKALVIMNYRHAFGHLNGDNGGKIENVGGFLMQAYPGRVANVMINSMSLLPGSSDMHAVMAATQEGKWDAAFAVAGNRDLGFDFAGTPFGEDGFDYFPFIPTHLRYRDVFTGFVFYKPLDEHQMSIGLPAGLYDEGFAREVVRRIRIMGDELDKEEVEKMFGEIHVFGYERGHETLPNIYKAGFEPSGYAEKIQRWLKAKP